MERKECWLLELQKEYSKAFQSWGQRTIEMRKFDPWRQRFAKGKWLLCKRRLRESDGDGPFDMNFEEQRQK